MIRPLLKTDLTALKDFTDLTIGYNYYTQKELEEIFEKSQLNNEMFTLVLILNNQIQGVRITYPPTQWVHGKGQGLSINKWPHTIYETAYFQSLFISPKLSGKGYGKKLSMAAIEKLKSIGTKGIVCHSWKESPMDSSGRYLRSLGFQIIDTHPLYWKQVDYECTRCGNPCLCTAEEMYLDLVTGDSL